MTFENAISLIAGAILGVVFQWLFERSRLVADDYELWVDIQVRSLRSKGASRLGTNFEYLVDGEVVVENPVEVDLFLWSAGRRDIPRAHFDDSRPLSITLGAAVVSELDGGGSNATDDVAMTLAPHGELLVEPSLIRKTMAVHYRLLMDGNPTISVENPIENVTVRSFYHDWRSHRRSAQKWIGLLIILSFFAAFVLAIVFDDVTSGWLENAGLPPAIIALVGVSLFFLGTGLMTSSDLAPRRAQRAVRTLRRSLGARVIDWARAPSPGSELTSDTSRSFHSSF
jgi:hypothetical protein